MADTWICIMVDVVFHRGDKNEVEKRIRSIFQEDLKVVQFVCNDVMWQSGEYFCFVRCDNYHEHLVSLRRNCTALRVVPSCDAPKWFSNKEVDEFIRSVSKVEEPDDFSRGDIVIIRDGFLKNLYGLVIKRSKEKRYHVSFKFHTRRFVREMSVRSLKFIGNVFKNKKFPITQETLRDKGVPKSFVNSEAREALSKFVRHSQICRKKNRGGVQAE